MWTALGCPGRAKPGCCFRQVYPGNQPTLAGTDSGPGLFYLWRFLTQEQSWRCNANWLSS